MKIDKLYVACCKTDFYFTRICVASVRYWNKKVPIVLIKDRSRGDFDTNEMERLFSVSIADIPFRNMGGYGKLYPFMNVKSERIFLQDSDIVWLGDLIDALDHYNEDLIVDSYIPQNADEEINKWYINMTNFKNYYSDYLFPGFLFNAGQLIFLTDSFEKKDFESIIKWEEGLKPIAENVFLCEDQGILNYVVSKKLRKQEITIREQRLYFGGRSKEASQFTVRDIKKRIAYPYLIHWFGLKKGLISFLPNSTLLKFYEQYYYKHLRGGLFRLYLSRFKRTIWHFDVFIYESLKVIYYKLRFKKRKTPISF